MENFSYFVCVRARRLLCVMWCACVVVAVALIQHNSIGTPKFICLPHSVTNGWWFLLSLLVNYIKHAII